MQGIRTTHEALHSDHVVRAPSKKEAQLKARLHMQASPERQSGAGGGSRTHTALRPTDFESAASAIPPLRPCGCKSILSTFLLQRGDAKLVSERRCCRQWCRLVAR